MDIRTAIEAGDAERLSLLLAEDPSRADAVIRWGRGNECHPIHYVCDKVFDGTLKDGRELPLVRALIEAGADIDFGNGDPLNAAASLGAIEVAFVLLDAGARTDLLGAFGETALHWAAYIGAHTLVERLLEAGAPVDVRDARWDGTPLDWARHGASKAPVPADSGGHQQCIERLAQLRTE